MFMVNLFFTMEWSYTSIMHVVEIISETEPDSKRRYILTPLCMKPIRLRAHLEAPVKNYIQTEAYIDNPKFEFLDHGDTIAQAVSCDACMNIAGLKLMVEEADQKS